MKTIKTAVVLGVLAVSVTAQAHPLGVPFASRGECEEARAKADRSHGTTDLENGTFDTRGEANVWMHEAFRCENIGDAWFIVRE